MKQNKYYTVKEPFKYSEMYKDARFTSHSFRTGKTIAYYVDGHTEPSTQTYDSCEEKVNLNIFKRLTYKEAMAMIKLKPEKIENVTPKKDDDKNDISDDTYAIQCFMNGERKFTDKLTQNQAYNFRKAAEHLYRYLTNEYNLEKYKNG